MAKSKLDELLNLTKKLEQSDQDPDPMDRAAPDDPDHPSTEDDAVCPQCGAALDVDGDCTNDDCDYTAPAPTEDDEPAGTTCAKCGGQLGVDGKCPECDKPSEDDEPEPCPKCGAPMVGPNGEPHECDNP